MNTSSVFEKTPEQLKVFCLVSARHRKSVCSYLLKINIKTDISLDQKVWVASESLSLSWWLKFIYLKVKIDFSSQMAASKITNKQRITTSLNLVFLSARERVLQIRVLVAQQAGGLSPDPQRTGKKTRGSHAHHSSPELCGCTVEKHWDLLASHQPIWKNWEMQV